MNLKQLKEIINSPIPSNVMESLIIASLAKDKNVMKDILALIEEERNTNNELISEFNLQLSRAHIHIDCRPESKSESKESANKSFIMDEIAKFYIKYKGVVTHLYNRFN